MRRDEVTRARIIASVHVIEGPLLLPAPQTVAQSGVKHLVPDWPMPNPKKSALRLG
jgi:hypothetical protein